MGAHLHRRGVVEQDIYDRPRGTLSNETVVLSLAYCLGRPDIRSIRDLDRLTRPEKREVRRILTSIDPPSDQATFLQMVAAERAP